MTDIIERLRNRALAAAIIKDKPDLYNDAADAIIRLRAENEKLREALAPFATASRHFKDDCKDTLVVSIGVDVGYLRAAAAAIRESGE